MPWLILWSDNLLWVGNFLWVYNFCGKIAFMVLNTIYLFMAIKLLWQDRFYGSKNNISFYGKIILMVR